MLLLIGVYFRQTWEKRKITFSFSDVNHVQFAHFYRCKCLLTLLSAIKILANYFEFTVYNKTLPVEPLNVKM